VWTNRSCGYDTREALLEGEGVHDKPCKLCGNIYGTKYTEPTHTQLIERGECFTCNFWYGISLKGESSVIIDQSHYQIGEEDTHKDAWKGHGGRKFTIQMDDGTVFQTTNLWSQGNIPDHIVEHYGDRFINTGIFL
jgi:hypothetical protein